MPVVYICKACGKPLIVYIRQGQDSYGVPTPSEIIEMYGGVCPWCGAQLGKPTVGDITVIRDKEKWKKRLMDVLSMLPDDIRRQLLRELEKLESRRRLYESRRRKSNIVLPRVS